MKTIYSIGRDPGCDIYIYDDRNLISRNHAILKVGKGGKYYILDQSMNGTYINGIKVTPGVQVPVTRKDVISFAHIAELDWDQVPKTGFVAGKTALISFAAALVLGAAGYCAYTYITEHSQKDPIVNPPIPEMTEKKDTTVKDVVKVEPVKEKKKESKPKPAKKTEVKKDSVEVKDTVKPQPFV